MTATLAPPLPPPPTGRTSSRIANRAVARWSRRMLRREWRQQLLILALLTVSVAATTVGLGLVVNVQSSDQAFLGSASLRMDVQTPAGGAASVLAQAQRHFHSLETIEHAWIAIPGSTASIDVRAEAEHGRFSSPMLRVVSGHYPAAGQVAITRSLLSIFSLHVGQSWRVLGQDRVIVGIVENPKDLSDSFALVAPGQIASPVSVSFLSDDAFSGSTGLDGSGARLINVFADGTSSASRQRNQALAVLLLATIGLTFVSLLSVAGFTVMAQRRLRSLGMIGAIGATDRQVRKVMLANGTAVGFVGAVVGTVLGLLTWFVLKPVFENVVGHRIQVFALPWWAVFAAGALAVLASLAASWWPARTVSRMPVIAALSGRPPAPKPAHRFALAGALLAGAGFVLLVLSHNVHTVEIVSGIVLTTVGTLLLAPLGIRLIALGAGHVPVAVRLALRDLARYQARSGAALAAAALAVGIAATIAITAAAQQSHDRSFTEGNLPANQAIVWVGGDPQKVAQGPGISAAPVSVNGPSAADIARARVSAASIAASLRAAAPLELDALRNPAAVDPNGPPGQASLVRPIVQNGHRGFTFVSDIYLATPALLAHYGISPSDIPVGTDIITSDSSVIGAKVFAGERDVLHPATIRLNGKVPAYTSSPDVLMLPAAARSLGLVADPAGFLIDAPKALSAAQVRDARQVAAASNVLVETRNAADHSLQQLGEYSTVVGMLVALAVLAMTVGLIRSETSGDLRTLTAAGAGGATRRMLTATTAASLGLLGAIIGVAGAYLALIAWHWGDVSYLDQPPWLELAVLVAGLPLVALAGGWLFGRTPSRLARVRSE